MRYIEQEQISQILLSVQTLMHFQWMNSIELPWASHFPGKAHKCGHDGHSATLAGFALEIDQVGADKNIFFLFQPAEETGDGAIQCVDFIKEHILMKFMATII